LRLAGLDGGLDLLPLFLAGGGLKWQRKREKARQ
jgi:hypothetical protein